MTPAALPADVVAVVAGVKEDFFKTHRKDRKRAQEAWHGLVERRERLRQDTSFGKSIAGDRWPDCFQDLKNLYLIEELPHRFRALYTVLRDPVHGIAVQIEWIGDHREYDALFGYRTSWRKRPGEQGTVSTSGS